LFLFVFVCVCLCLFVCVCVCLCVLFLISNSFVSLFALITPPPHTLSAIKRQLLAITTRIYVPIVGAGRREIMNVACVCVRVCVC